MFKSFMVIVYLLNLGVGVYNGVVTKDYSQASYYISMAILMRIIVKDME